MGNGPFGGDTLWVFGASEGHFSVVSPLLALISDFSGFWCFLSLFALILRVVRLVLRFPILPGFFAPRRFVVFLVSTGLAAPKTCSTLCF